MGKQNTKQKKWLFSKELKLPTLLALVELQLKKLAYQMNLRKKLNQLDYELLEITFLETKRVWENKTQSKKSGFLVKN